MTGFQFPPPPPPPPKATSNDAQDHYASQRGRPNNARGGRGQGWQGRGRGNNNRGNARGGRGNAQQQRGGPRGGDYTYGERGGYQQQRPQPAQYTPQHYVQQNSAFNPSGAGADANTTPVIPGHQYGGPTQPQVDPAAFAQAMSFMTTPAGMQTFAAFASNMANGGQAPYGQQAPPQQHHERVSSPEAYRKRKRGDQNPGGRLVPSPTTTQSPSSKTRPPKAKAAPPPAIPSFGFSLPTAPTSTVSNGNKGATNKATGIKRKIRLGLTYDDKEEKEEEEVNSEVDEDIIDEEAVLASTLGTEGVSFEHNGVLISLQTPAEVADWIKDRRKQYPTKKRVAEKEQEKAERREHELEFLRRVQGKKKRVVKQRDVDPSSSTASQENATKEQKADLEALRAKVEASRAANRRGPETAEQAQVNLKPATLDLGLGYDSETESDDDILMEESSVVSSSSDESEESSDDADSDSDSGPEEQPSNIAPVPIVVPLPPPPPPKPVPERKDAREARECYSWMRYGNCKAGDRCRYTHGPREEEKPLSLYERLVEQEKEKADRLALDTIKWLGQNGFLG